MDTNNNIQDNTNSQNAPQGKKTAAGEAFDKVARVLGLTYPGGVNIERLAKNGQNNIEFPKMLKGKGGYDFSYSGLKTAVINYVHTNEMKGVEIIDNKVRAISVETPGMTDFTAQARVEAVLGLYVDISIVSIVLVDVGVEVGLGVHVTVHLTCGAYTHNLDIKIFELKNIKNYYIHIIIYNVLF